MKAKLRLLELGLGEAPRERVCSLEGRTKRSWVWLLLDRSGIRPSIRALAVGIDGRIGDALADAFRLWTI